MADQIRVSEALAKAYGNHFTNAWMLISIVILCYDHLLTLESEITYMWKRPKRLSFFLFILIRYFSLLSNVAMLFPRCYAWNVAKPVLIILQSFLVNIILGMRIYAMYGFSKRVLIILCGVGLTTFALAAWSTRETSVPASVIGAIREPPLSESLKNSGPLLGLAGAWEAQFLCDLSVFGFTIIRAYRQPIKTPGSILSFMVRDGTIRIILNRALTLANLANILMYYFGDVIFLPLTFLSGAQSEYDGQSWTAASLSAFTSMLSITMVSRLMLNLHKAANVGIFTDTQSVQTALEFQSDRIRYDEEANVVRGLKAQVETGQTVSSWEV
ncbi:hypothetical protein B0H13DRAFT_1904120 [Mycena leptocephala]|nr:hypothetical protein B0H13DRAFT_1904120 [Mycena leptocephala]